MCERLARLRTRLGSVRIFASLGDKRRFLAHLVAVAVAAAVLALSAVGYLYRDRMGRRLPRPALTAPRAALPVRFWSSAAVR
ncbi:hypothetical protein [Halobellus sp. EA9]|uniref:hypothetical protein n=1 Tax=Halobellus sp. EA9 TaxID=3421647 RepID=UPI003EC09EF0